LSGPRIAISVQSGPFDVAAEMAAISQKSEDIGAVTSFVGLCRSEDGRLSALELEHYPGMAEDEIGRVADEAVNRWPLNGITVIHRYGVITPGEGIVLVITASAHRAASFEAAEFLMDYLKTRAPFWKKEHRSDGGHNSWVAAKVSDDQASGRWKHRS
jgi:molybdopterin synthase catalytic subunit